ncbi:MAG: DUF1987 domain-containing protein [Bacteroidia bacterium]
METVALCVKGTEDTPEINFITESREFVLSGRSLPEDVTSFYKPVFEWMDVYFKDEKEEVTFKFKLEYFNTASSKIILDILMKLEELISSQGALIKVEWHHDAADDDMFEAGEEYKELVEVPFTLIGY